MRVTVSDGLHQASAEVGPLAVRYKDPVVYVLTPDSGAELQAGAGEAAFDWGDVEHPQHGEDGAGPNAPGWALPRSARIGENVRSVT